MIEKSQETYHKTNQKHLLFVETKNEQHCLYRLCKPKFRLQMVQGATKPNSENPVSPQNFWKRSIHLSLSMQAGAESSTESPWPQSADADNAEEKGGARSAGTEDEHETRKSNENKMAPIMRAVFIIISPWKHHPLRRRNVAGRCLICRYIEIKGIFSKGWSLGNLSSFQSWNGDSEIVGHVRVWWPKLSIANSNLIRNARILERDKSGSVMAGKRSIVAHYPHIDGEAVKYRIWQKPIGTSSIGARCGRECSGSDTLSRSEERKAWNCKWLGSWNTCIIRTAIRAFIVNEA